MCSSGCHRNNREFLIKPRIINHLINDKLLCPQGHDTTSAGICWALYLLGLHPDVQVMKSWKQIVLNVACPENNSGGFRGPLNIQ
jgi:hypothetical protein